MNQIVLNAVQAQQLLNNAFMGRDIRTPLYDGAFGTRDIDAECGYPESIQPVDYVRMYERHDIAARVVDIEANECWKEYPSIYETEEERETAFEKAVDKLVSKTNLYSYLLRVDRISGIGRYGVLFIGFDDGKEFSEPAPGYDDSGPLDSPGNAKVLYYRVMDETAATIDEFENDKTNPRFGQPKFYTLQFAEHVGTGAAPTLTPTSESVKVHWSRIVHVADNLTTSEVFGMPRMQNVFNRLYDLRKINGGSAEMFWKGGFPGYSFEVDPKAGEFSADDKTALKQETKAYSEGMQRYLTTVGVSVKSLSPQVADPTPNVLNALRIIAITKGIPFPILVGNETGQIAGTSQAMLWGERVAFRRNMYVTPHIIRVTLDRLIQAGAIPAPEPIDGEESNYTVKWVPLATLTEVERAQVGKDLTEALARYSTAGGEALVPLGEFLGKFLGFSFQQVEAIMKAPPTSLSVVLQELAMMGQAGGTGAAGGNMPTSIPNMAKTKDPGKTPTNMVQKKKGSRLAPRKQVSKTAPGSVQE